jgi:hypothetical protein
VSTALAAVKGHAMDALKNMRLPVYLLAKGLDSLEVQISKKLKKVDGAAVRYACGGSLRANFLRVTLLVVTTYSKRPGRLGFFANLFSLACASSQKKLSKDEADLLYIIEKITALEGQITSEVSWRDVAATWKSLLDLVTQLGHGRARAVLECILADEKVLKALGAAAQLRLIDSKPPTVLITLLNDGPGAHVRDHAYAYRRELERELAKVCVCVMYCG